MSELPTPGYGMDDASAADWLSLLAESFPSVDRINIMEYVATLRIRESERVKEEEAARKAEKARIKAMEDDIEDMEDEIRRTERDLERARDELAETRATEGTS